MEPEKGEGIDPFIREDVDVASVSAAPAIRSSTCNSLFSSEADTSVPPLTSKKRNLYLIDKHTQRSVNPLGRKN
jgi:hypothetical protein